MQTKNQSLPKDSQLVFITDETGIFDTFEQLKGQLGQLTARFITLIYAVNETDNDHFPFFRELNILEKRFSEKFIVHKLPSDSVPFYVNSIIQECLEAIINSSIEPKLEFSIFGAYEFVNQINDILGFLNIKSTFIKSKTIQ
jgi:hypothetical protein